MALQVADWWLTTRILAQGGSELNPVLRWVIERGGTGALLAVKLLIGGGAMWLLRPYPYIVAAACAVYAGIVVWNYRQLKR